MVPVDFFGNFPSLLELDVPSLMRLMPTRFAADAIQVLPFALVDVNELGVEERLTVGTGTVIACWVDATVGDMKRGEFLMLPMFWFCDVEVTALAEEFNCDLLMLLAFAVISVRVPILKSDN